MKFLEGGSLLYMIGLFTFNLHVLCFNICSLINLHNQLSTQPEWLNSTFFLISILTFFSHWQIFVDYNC